MQPTKEQSIKSLEMRLSQLQRLEPGWLDGCGKAVEPAAIDNARQLLTGVIELGEERPRVYPTFEGAIQAEWNFDVWTIDVSIGTKEISVIGLNIETNTESELEGAIDAQRLVAWLKSFRENIITS